MIADDSGLLRLGLARLLADAGIDVIAQAEDADQLLSQVARERPDVAVVDIRMPPTHTDEGLVAAASIRAQYPDVAVLVLSQHVEAEYALQLLRESEGGTGYLLKDRVLEASELVDALHRVHAGETVVDRELVSQLVTRPRQVDPLEVLTPREREVLGLLAEGLTDRGIADRLVVSENTVETHVRHVFAKLDLPSSQLENRRVHAVLAYLRA